VAPLPEQHPSQWTQKTPSAKWRQSRYRLPRLAPRRVEQAFHAADVHVDSMGSPMQRCQTQMFCVWLLECQAMTASPLLQHLTQLASTIALNAATAGTRLNRVELGATTSGGLWLSLLESEELATFSLLGENEVSLVAAFCHCLCVLSPFAASVS